MSEDISIHLKWYHKYQFAGYYAAQQQGYFQDEDLTVRLIEGGPNTNHLHQLINGSSQYAVLGSEALGSLALGSPIIIVASIFQHAPEMLMTLRSNQVESIQDLRGKSLMLANGEIAGQIPAMLLKNNLTSKDYLRANYDGDVTRLANGAVFAMYGYISNEPFLLQEMGYEVDYFRPQDYGINFYGDNLATSQSELDNNPSRVAAIRRAVIRGWSYALNHPKEIIHYLLSLPTKNPQPYTLKHQQYEAQATFDLIDINDVPIGTSSPDRWAAMLDVFNSTSGGQAHFNPNSIYNEFHQDRSWINYVLIAAILASIIILFMYSWNRALQSKLNTAISSLEKVALEDVLTGLKNRSSMMLFIKNAVLKRETINFSS